jgi:hypothetical protein
MQFRYLSLSLSLLLPAYFSFHSATAFDKTSADIQIKNTLAKYPLSVDSKNYTIIPEIFTEDAFLGSPPPTGNFIGIPTIIKFLTTALENTVTQHSYGTQFIDVSSEKEANAITYLTATFVGTGPKAGRGLVVHAQYLDMLVYLEDVGWRVTNRTLAIMVG